MTIITIIITVITKNNYFSFFVHVLVDRSEIDTVINTTAMKKKILIIVKICARRFLCEGPHGLKVTHDQMHGHRFTSRTGYRYRYYYYGPVAARVQESLASPCSPNQGLRNIMLIILKERILIRRSKVNISLSSFKSRCADVIFRMRMGRRRVVRNSSFVPFF